MNYSFPAYTLALFSEDGDVVYEGNFVNHDQAWSRCENMGSRWIFYPIPTVVRLEDQKIVDAVDLMSWMIGLTVAQARSCLSAIQE